MTSLQLITLGAVVLLMGLVALEMWRLKRLVSPLVMLVLPFIFIFSITNFVLINMKFPAIPVKTIIFLTAQFLLFWLVGVILRQFFPGDFLSKAVDYSSVEKFYSRFTPVFIFLGVVSALIIVRKALGLFAEHGGFNYFAHSDYEKQMTRGVASHFIQLAKVSFFMLVVTYRQVRYKLILWIVFLVMALAIALVQIKYHVLHLLFMVILYFALTKPFKQQVKILLTAAMTLLIVFNLFWIILASIGGIQDLELLKKIIFRYMVNYLASGTMLLHHWMEMQDVKPDWALLVTLKNMWNAVVGNPMRYNMVQTTSADFMWVAPGIISNVATAYGPFFLIGGAITAWAYTFVSAGLYYGVYYLSLIYRSAWLIFMNLLFLVFALFTFFGLYFLSPSTIEMPVLLALLIGGIHLWVKIRRILLGRPTHA